jgi:hypothetical protein
MFKGITDCAAEGKRRQYVNERSAEEIYAYCKHLLEDKQYEPVVHLVAISSNPSAAVRVLTAHGYTGQVIKDARWLAVLKRDYPIFYQSVVTNPHSSRQRDET